MAPLNHSPNVKVLDPSDDQSDMKTIKSVFNLGLTAFVINAVSVTAMAYEPSWDGNHPEAASEAWTWMGHLQELEKTSSGDLRLGKNGLGFIYYFTRNQTGSMGAMNFRSSSVTTTVNGEGVKQETDTVYTAQVDNSEFRARTGTMDLNFRAGSINDRVQAVPMTEADSKSLARIMKLYPGLSIAANFQPKKNHFEVTERNGVKTVLDLYSIWPVAAPPEGKMAFLGQAETYSFSEPMVVAIGTYKGKSVAGLTFVDRQWSKEYFGTYALDGLNDLMKYANAMKYSHTWSAFHVFNERTKEWSFFHLWNQFKRTPEARDQKVDYSGMVWVTNGGPTQITTAQDYSWVGSGFVHNTGREVLMNYPNDRYGFFPSKAHMVSKKMGFDVKMYATPALQNLNQPIPFYEAYASGEGTWNGDKVRVQGRLESSRLMFRTQDYEEMIDVLKAEEDKDWRQPELQAWLKGAIARDNAVNPFDWLEERMQTLASVMSNMDLKLSVFKAILNGNKDAADPNDPMVMVYH